MEFFVVLLCGILQMSRVGLEWHGASDDFLIHTSSGWGCPTKSRRMCPHAANSIRLPIYIHIVPVLQHLELHKFLCRNSNTMDGILQFDEFADPQCDGIGYYVTSTVGRGLCSNMLQKVITHVISF